MANSALFVFLVVMTHCFLQSFSTDMELLPTKTIEMETQVNDDDAKKIVVLENTLLNNSDKILNKGFEDFRFFLNYFNNYFRESEFNTMDCSKGLSFKENLVKVEVLADAQKNYFDNSNTITRDLFIKACKDYPMSYVTKWIRGEISRENLIQPLIADLGRSDTYKQFLEWSGLVVATFMKASILGHMCLGKVYENNQHLYDTREIYRKNARRDLRSILEILIDNFKSNMNATDYVRTIGDDCWMNFAFDDVNNLLHTFNTNKSNQTFVDSVYDHLANKYSWKSWVVTSWFTNNRHFNFDFRKCNASATVNYGHRFRRGFITSFDHITFDSRHGSVDHIYDKCVDKYWLKPRYCGESCSCEEFVEEYENCVKKENPEEYYIRDMYCFDDKNDLKISGDEFGWNATTEFKHYSVSLVKVEGGFTSANVHPGEHYITKDIILSRSCSLNLNT